MKDVLRVRHRLLKLAEVEGWRALLTVPRGNRGSMEKLLQGSMHRASELQQELGVPPLLVELLVGIDKKLDALLRLLKQPALSEDEYEETGEVEISGSGMCFATQVSYQTGSRLALTITLPTFPPRELLILGSVARAAHAQKAPTGDRLFATSVHFEEIHEDDRDLLVRYTFQRQRELVRRNHLSS